MDTTVTNIKIPTAGSSIITSQNGVFQSSPTDISFNNDLSRGTINQSTERKQSLQSVENVKLNHNLTVGGSSQIQAGGMWFDIGTAKLHQGTVQDMATSTNDELFALLAQYPDRDNGEPVYNPLPNLETNLLKAQKMTAGQPPCELPTITRPTDIGKWVSAWTTNMIQQNTSNLAQRAIVAAQMTKEDLDEQIKTQEEYLKGKFGDELYLLFYKQKVEEGAVYLKDVNPYSITKDDVVKAAMADGKVEKRNAYLAQLG